MRRELAGVRLRDIGWEVREHVVGRCLLLARVLLMGGKGLLAVGRGWVMSERPRATRRGVNAVAWDTVCVLLVSELAR